MIWHDIKITSHPGADHIMWWRISKTRGRHPRGIKWLIRAARRA